MEVFNDDRYKLIRIKLNNFKMLNLILLFGSCSEIIDSSHEDSCSEINSTDSSHEDSCSETNSTDSPKDSEITIYVGKTFESWDYVEDFMKTYASAKGHGVRIGGGGRVDKEIKQILKRTYLYRHAGKPKSTSGKPSCRVSCP